MRIFLAGAAGVIGRRLTPLLVLMGHEVTGTTRSAAKAGSIEAMCGRPGIVDVFGAAAAAQARRTTCSRQVRPLACVGMGVTAICVAFCESRGGAPRDRAECRVRL